MRSLPVKRTGSTESIVIAMVAKYLRDTIDWSTFRPSSNLVHELAFDSLDLTSLFMQVEERFNISLDGTFGSEQLVPITCGEIPAKGFTIQQLVDAVDHQLKLALVN